MIETGKIVTSLNIKFVCQLLNCYHFDLTQLQLSSVCAGVHIWKYAFMCVTVYMCVSLCVLGYYFYYFTWIHLVQNENQHLQCLEALAGLRSHLLMDSLNHYSTDRIIRHQFIWPCWTSKIKPIRPVILLFNFFALQLDTGVAL